MSFPKSFARKTKHRKPRFQLYQPGFNPDNSCWLPGDWITVSEEEWNGTKDDHVRMYAHVAEAAKKQHHRDDPTPMGSMTPAQRQAWEHFSGEASLQGRNQFGQPITMHIKMAGKRVQDSQASWMRKKGFRFFQAYLAPDGAEVNQVEEHELPEDLLLPADDRPNFWKEIVKTNQARQLELVKAFLRPPTAPPIKVGPIDDMALATVMSSLLEQEESIIRSEVLESRGSPDKLMSVEDEIAHYVAMRAEARKAMGDDLDRLLADYRKSHNELARENLDRCPSLGCYVLPEFRDDGSHDPWGPDDVPEPLPDEE